MFTSLAYCCVVSGAHAQNLLPLHEVPESGELALSYVASEIDIDIELPTEDFENEIERTIVALSYHFPIGDDLSIPVAIGYTTKAEIEFVEIIDSNDLDPGDAEGDGFIVQVGINNRFYSKDQFQFIGSLKGTYIDEVYGAVFDRFGSTDIEGSIFEVAATGTGVFQASEKVKLYGGLEQTPLSDGEIQGNKDIDTERAGLVVLRLGVDFTPSDRIALGLEANVAGESSYRASIGYRF